MVDSTDNSTVGGSTRGSTKIIQPPALTKSKYVLARYGIQVADGGLEVIPSEGTVAANAATSFHSEYEEYHYHPGPRAIECKTDAGRFRCDRDSWMRIVWCYLLPCALIEQCFLNCCDCIWDCVSANLRRMEEHYTFQCCDYCCKLKEEEK